MKTFTTPLPQKQQFQTTVGQTFVPALTSSVNDILAFSSAVIAATAIIMLSVWVAGLAMSNVLGASIWGIGFIFLGLAVDNPEPKGFLHLATGISLLVLAWLQTTVSSDFAIVSGVLVASWVAAGLFKRLR